MMVATLVAVVVTADAPSSEGTWRLFGGTAYAEPMMVSPVSCPPCRGVVVLWGGYTVGVRVCRGVRAGAIRLARERPGAVYRFLLRASMRRSPGQRVPHRLHHALPGLPLRQQPHELPGAARQRGARLPLALLSPGPPPSSPSHAPGRTHSGLSADDSISDDPLAIRAMRHYHIIAIPYVLCNADHRGWSDGHHTTASHGAYSIETSRENPLAERGRRSAVPRRGGIRADKRAMR
jgi:hypothetical protein